MDELERLIRAAKPGSSNRNLPLTERAELDLARIKAGAAASSASPPAMRRLPIYFTVAAAVIAVMALVVTFVAFPRPAFAATPPVLVAQPTTHSVLEAMQPMLDELRRTGDVAYTQTQTIRVQTWSLVVSDTNELPSVVAPEDLTILRTSEGSRQLTATAGTPYDATGRPVHDSESPAPGTLLWEERSAPGDYEFQFPTEPPTTADGFADYLHDYAGLPYGADASAHLAAVPQLLMERELTAAQEHALLSLLAELPDLEVAGTVTDRLGRPGVAFQGPPVGDYRNLLVISTETGRILSFETLYVGHDRTDIPSPAVIAYYAWERTPK